MPLAAAANRNDRCCTGLFGASAARAARGSFASTAFLASLMRRALLAR
jgi:hypothetical protein